MNQPDLFINEPDRRRKRPTRGRQYRDHGIEKVAGNNEEFLAKCRNWAIRECLENGMVTIEQVRKFAEYIDITPSHPNPRGAECKSKGLKPGGVVQNHIESAHARMVRVWVYEPPQ